MAKLTEERLLADYLRPLCDPAVSHNLLDDSAALPRGDYIVSTDNLVQGVHFLPSASPADIAARLAARNLSDMAGSAARPRYYLLNWVVSAAQDEAWVAEFCRTLGAWQKQYGMRLIGGDGSQAPQVSKFLSLSMTIFGEPLRIPPPLRSDAKIGDILCVSGTIGTAYLGLQALRGEAPLPDFLPDFLPDLPQEVLDTCRKRFLSPQIRCDEIAAITDFLGTDLHALMDISDGLFMDAERLAKASQVSAEIDVTRLPLLAQVAAQVAERTAEDNDLSDNLIAKLISGGDDYELLFSLPEARAQDFADFCRAQKIPITAIGKIIDKTDKPPYESHVRFVKDGILLPFRHKGWEIDYG